MIYLSCYWLTSDELSSEGICVVDAESVLGANGKAILFLIKANVANFVRASSSRYCHSDTKEFILLQIISVLTGFWLGLLLRIFGFHRDLLLLKLNDRVVHAGVET